VKRPDLKQALGRLLGPTGPELGCDQCFQDLDRYVELEFAGRDADAEIPGLQAHLAGCPACREEHESLRALVGSDRVLYARLGLRPVALESRCRSSDA
jgi:anti-sigma factor RsiW